jgi:selenocysteine-specific elongation factor
MVLAPPGALRPTCVLDARVRAIAPMRHNMHLTLHTGADEANAQLRLLDRDDLCTGEEAWAQVKLESAVAVEKRDRFVLRTSNDTVGGGIIVDIAPKRHRRKHLPTLDRLAAMLSEAPTDLMLDAVARSPLVERVVCVASASIDRETADAAIDALLASGAVRVFGDEPGALLATATYVDEAHDRAVDALAAYHAAHPLRAGIPVEDLRSRLRVDARQLAALIDGWPEAQSTTTTVSLASFRPAPSTEQRAAADAYLAALQASPERPPTLSIEPEVLTHLVQTGAVIDTGGGIVFDAQTFASMRQRVRSHIEQHGAITLAEARDLLGTSRRYVQSLLEHLDRERVTRRIGEARVLR